MIPFIDMVVIESVTMPATANRRGRVQLYVTALKQYIQAIEADHALTRTRMLEAAQQGRIEYPFWDVMQIERAIAAGKDPYDYARIAAAALLYMSKHMKGTSVPEWEKAVSEYEDLRRWYPPQKREKKTYPGDPASKEGLYLVTLPEEVFETINQITDYLLDNDIEVPYLSRGSGTQIVTNLAVIFAGRRLLKAQ